MDEMIDLYPSSELEDGQISSDDDSIPLLLPDGVRTPPAASCDGREEASQQQSGCRPATTMLDDFVGLNVGGVVYRSTLRTLTMNHDSLFAKMFSSPMRPSHQDKDGNYVIDADGEMFKYILNYLRRGTPCLPRDFKDQALLIREAEFYGLFHLKDIIDPPSLPSAPKKAPGFIEAYVREKDNESQQWRIHGPLDVLNEVSVLKDYLHAYRKGSRCVNFITQHSMFPNNKYRRFPKSTLFTRLFGLGFRLHTTDSITIISDESDETPWLRYVFVR